MEVLVLSALAEDTGSCLRARALARALAPHARVRFVRPPRRSLPWLLEVALSLPRYAWAGLVTPADWVLGVKPFPNVGAALFLARLRGRATLVDVDDLDHAWFPGWKGALVLLAQAPLPRRCDLVSYHNENLGRWLREERGVAPERLFRLLQGVDLGVFHPRPEPVEPGSLLYVGHLNVASELPRILEAVALVAARRAVRLTVAGGGPCLAQMRERARRAGLDARFTGPLAPQGIARAIARAEVCLVWYPPGEANRHRSSMKLRECLAMGRKVVCNGFDELAEFAALVYRPEAAAEEGIGPEAYAAAIERALDAGDGREARAPAFVAERYDWRRLGSELADRLAARLAGR